MYSSGTKSLLGIRCILSTGTQNLLPASPAGGTITAIAAALQREVHMPEIIVYAVEGRSIDQKRALIKDITSAVVRNFDVDAEAVTIQIVEAPKTSKAKGGVLFSERAPAKR